MLPFLLLTPEKTTSSTTTRPAGDERKAAPETSNTRRCVADGTPVEERIR
jgi:hypothetical protein